MTISNNTTTTQQTDVEWPKTPSAILIMGKRQGTKKENKQLRGRVALAAALWYSAPDPKPYLLFVASDTHGPTHTPDAKVVKKMLVDQFGISADFVMLRPVSNCTLLEVRATRVLSRFYGLSHIFALTHLYHALRAQRYLSELLPEAAVIPVHPDILNEIVFPLEYTDLLLEIEALVVASQPSKLDIIREMIIEWLLSRAHSLDPRGKFERWLARRLRPRAYSRHSF
jgi:hypothetical protein